MLSIGELSRVTRLSVKALRLYHEKGLLVPDRIDSDSKYRYYRDNAVERGMVIQRLKGMGFSLLEIKEILLGCDDDRQIVGYVEKKLAEVSRLIRNYQDMEENLGLFLKQAGVEDEEMSREMEIKKEIIPTCLMASIRFKGEYSQVGSRFATLARTCGRHVKGKAFSLYYDGEYKEHGADIEACMEVKRLVSTGAIECRELEGGKAVTLIHKGPYEELGRSYHRLYSFCREQGIEPLLPHREYYLKGPGIIFRGNPKKYVTRLVFLYC